jgi:hypothetical protein
LAGAGVVTKVGYDFVINDDVVQDLVGISIEVVDAWTNLTREQRLFLTVLKHSALVEGSGYVLVKDVRHALELEHPYVSISGNLRNKVIDPLEAGGWLESVEKQAAGKSGKVRPTARLLESEVSLAEDLSSGLIPAEIRKRLNTSLEDVLLVLSDEAGPKHDRGLALEVLGLRLAYDVGLTPMGFRLRASEAGYGEIDLLAEGAHLMFSRWLFQCKAITGTVGLSDLAKELGMALLVRAHVVVMVTTGSFSSTLVNHAKKATENTPIQVVLIDGSVLASYRTRGVGALLDHLERTATATLLEKRHQVHGLV